MRHLVRLLGAFCFIIIASGLMFATDSSNCLQSPATKVRLVAAAEDMSSFTVTDTSDYDDVPKGKEECFRITKTFMVPERDLRNTLKQAMNVQTGDYLNIEFADKNISNVAFSRNLEPVCAPFRWLLLLGTASLLFLLALLITWGHPFDILIGKDNRYSNSQTQAVVWFWIVISSYVAALMLRRLYAGPAFLGGVNVPDHLLLLSGLSAITFAGAKAITVAKNHGAEKKTIAPNKKEVIDPNKKEVIDPNKKEVIDPNKKEVLDPPLLTNAGKKHTRALKYLLSDLTQDDNGVFDFGDFQLMVLMLIAAVTYVVITFESLAHVEFRTSMTLRDVDTTILSLFGLGQGAYLAKKAVGKLGES